VKLDVSSEHKDKSVSVDVEASSLLREIVGVPAFGAGNVKTAIRRAAMLTGFSFNRVRKLWYLEARAILAVEMDALRQKAAKSREARNNEFRENSADVVRRLAAVEMELAALRGGMAGAQAHEAGAEAVAAGGDVRGGGVGMLASSAGDRPLADEGE
jgi:hypothetical protein